MQLPIFWQQFGAILRTAHRFLTLTSRPVYIRCSSELIWEGINGAMQESVKPYDVQNILPSGIGIKYTTTTSIVHLLKKTQTQKSSNNNKTPELPPQLRAP